MLFTCALLLVLPGYAFMDHVPSLDHEEGYNWYTRGKRDMDYEVVWTSPTSPPPTPLPYPCMEDWDIYCSEDFQCCSGKCNTPHCKLVPFEPKNKIEKETRILIQILIQDQEREKEKENQHPRGTPYSVFFGDGQASPLQGNYPCLEDWVIVCTLDSLGCSGTSVKPLCEIRGVKEKEKENEEVKEMKIEREENQYTRRTRDMGYDGPERTILTNYGQYPCMEDWTVVCSEDSDCCSGKCIKPLCKVLGNELMEEYEEEKEEEKKNEDEKEKENEKEKQHYPCLEDWVIVCSMDPQGCSGTSVKPFCEMRQVEKKKNEKEEVKEMEIEKDKDQYTRGTRDTGYSGPDQIILPSQGNKPFTNFPGKPEDYTILCSVDSQCYSGKCIKPFCKVLGIEKEEENENENGQKKEEKEGEKIEKKENQYTRGARDVGYSGTDRIISPLQRKYPCVKDWTILCSEDSQCCSGKCIKPFCKVLGIEKEVGNEKEMDAEKDNDQNKDEEEGKKIEKEENPSTRGTRAVGCSGRDRIILPLHRKYPCKEDWIILCSEDSQCCSGKCIKPFCKVLGIEK